jgi:hypothetical protein
MEFDRIMVGSTSTNDVTTRIELFTENAKNIDVQFKDKFERRFDKASTSARKEEAEKLRSPLDNLERARVTTDKFKAAVSVTRSEHAETVVSEHSAAPKLG